MLAEVWLIYLLEVGAGWAQFNMVEQEFPTRIECEATLASLLGRDGGVGFCRRDDPENEVRW